MKEFDHPDIFENRHIGPTSEELNEMVKTCGADSIEQLIDETIPEQIRLKEELKIQSPVNEHIYIEDLRKIAAKNKVFKSYIGMGYHPVILPSVIQRNILENPGWYTQYTPYQAEIAQGRFTSTMMLDTRFSC